MSDIVNEPLVLDSPALAGLEVVDLVADWDAGERIDISLLLEQFATPAALSEAETLVTVDPAGPGDVIPLELAWNGGLAILAEDLQVVSATI